MSLTRFAVEFRSQVDGSTLKGRASVFGQLADLGSHWEAIAPGAFDKVLADKATDVRALWNHDPSALLGRQSAGTLRLSIDDEGLAYEIDLPDTTVGRDVRALVARGDVQGSSFAFAPGADEWSKAPDGRELRTHTSVAQLVDVSPVAFPAYDTTTVSLRSHSFARTSVRSRLIRARHRARIHLGGWE